MAVTTFPDLGGFDSSESSSHRPRDQKSNIRASVGSRSPRRRSSRVCPVPFLASGAAGSPGLVETSPRSLPLSSRGVLCGSASVRFSPAHVRTPVELDRGPALSSVVSVNYVHRDPVPE